jgi:hypothetical protein
VILGGGSRLPDDTPSKVKEKEQHGKMKNGDQTLIANNLSEGGGMAPHETASRPGYDSA